MSGPLEDSPDPNYSTTVAGSLPLSSEESENFLSCYQAMGDLATAWPSSLKVSTVPFAPCTARRYWAFPNGWVVSEDRFLCLSNKELDRDPVAKQ
jgi:hypothetical protein